MSRIGKAPVAVPSGVQVQIAGAQVKAKGPQGELAFTLPSAVKAELKEGKVLLTADLTARKDASAIYGMSRARVANIVQGVATGFAKTLDVVGLGYKAAVEGEKLTLALGYSHPVTFMIPKGIKAVVDPKTVTITLSGADKDLVGLTAARLRAIKPPEPYKGTGIRYRGEHIVRKAGKTAAGVGGGGAGAKK